MKEKLLLVSCLSIAFSAMENRWEQTCSPKTFTPLEAMPKTVTQLPFQLPGATGILDGTKSQRLVLRNNLAEGVLVRLGLGNGTRYADFVTIPHHIPGEEVIYCAVTGKEISRRRLGNVGPTVQ